MKGERCEGKKNGSLVVKKDCGGDRPTTGKSKEPHDRKNTFIRSRDERSR